MNPNAFSFLALPARQMDDMSAVMQEHASVIFRIAVGSLKDDDAAQTIVQDCFLKAYRGRDQFRAEASLRTWLTRIALNLIRDRIRSRKIRFWRQLSECPVDQDAACRMVPDRRIDPLRQLTKEDTARLWNAVARLPPQDQRISPSRHGPRSTTRPAPRKTQRDRQGIYPGPYREAVWKLNFLGAGSPDSRRMRRLRAPAPRVPLVLRQYILYTSVL